MRRRRDIEDGEEMTEDEEDGEEDEDGDDDEEDDDEDQHGTDRRRTGGRLLQHACAPPRTGIAR